MAACFVCRKRPSSLRCGTVVYVSSECPVCLETKTPLVALPCGHTCCEADFYRLGFRLDTDVEAADDDRQPPSGAAALCPGGLDVGATVRIFGLSNRPELNGKIGTLQNLQSSNTWLVRLDSGMQLLVDRYNLKYVERAQINSAVCQEMQLSPVNLPIGATVKIVGLTRKPDLNGRVGKVLRATEEHRWEVQLVTGTQQKFSLKAINLEVLVDAMRVRVATPMRAGVQAPAQMRDAVPERAGRDSRHSHAARTAGPSGTDEGIKKCLEEKSISDAKFWLLTNRNKTQLQAYLRTIHGATTGTKAELVQRIVVHRANQN